MVLEAFEGAGPADSADGAQFGTMDPTFGCWDIHAASLSSGSKPKTTPTFLLPLPLGLPPAMEEP